MKLVGQNSSLDLVIVGYQFPDITEGGWDSNWLLVKGIACLDGKKWEFVDPCLTTLEAQRLANWLEATAQFENTGPYCDFVEPNLQFSRRRPNIVRISFALESQPPWADDEDDWDKHGFEVPVGPALLAAAKQMREQLRKFPIRGTLGSD